MAKQWCECNKCDGGKLIPKTTWYWHEKKMRMPYLHLPNGTLARRNLSLSLASESLVQVGVNESGEADPLDDIKYSLRSDSVCVIR